jgi:hypothetical protein
MAGIYETEKLKQNSECRKHPLLEPLKLDWRWRDETVSYDGWA